VSLRIHLDSGSLFCVFGIFGNQLAIVWKSLKVTGNVGIMLSLHLDIGIVWILELGNRTHYCLKSLGMEPITVFMLGIGTHYCLLLSMLGISIHLALGNPSNLFSFVLICSHSCEALNHCALCFLSVQVYRHSLRSSLNTCTARVPFTSNLSLHYTHFPVCSSSIPVHSAQGLSTWTSFQGLL
jgi:hypothetical protein